MLKPYQKAELTFDFVNEIGQDGRNSRTYVAQDHQLNAEIVMKQIQKERLNSPEEFFAESQALYASAHPNVVQIHYACFDDDHDHTFDIYQFGLTLYRMCNGDEHFYSQFAKYGPPDNFDREGFRFDVRNGRFPDRSSFLPHVPSTIRNVIRKCLQVDPAQRYGSAVEVANAIAGIAGNSLDWQLNYQDNRKVWTKNEKGTKYELMLHEDGSSECYKTVNDGPRRRVADACKQGITDRDLRRLFTDY